MKDPLELLLALGPIEDLKSQLLAANEIEKATLTTLPHKLSITITIRINKHLLRYRLINKKL